MTVSQKRSVQCVKKNELSSCRRLSDHFSRCRDTLGASWIAVFMAIAVGTSSTASALEIDWSGQFRTELSFIRSYTLDGSDTGGNYDAVRDVAGGYTIRGGGSNNAHLQTLFLRLKPKVVVNDNVYIKSEWWLGDPAFGLFGSAYPLTPDRTQFYSNQSRGAQITAQRLWLEALTEVGTLQVGRLPLHWGLGMVWNSGDGIWDKYQTTGDAIRLSSKFGAFSFAPSFVTYSMGNSLGGGYVFDPATSGFRPSGGNGQIYDMSLLLKYENLDEDFELGANFIRRFTGSAQDRTQGIFGTPASFNYNNWDLYGRKRLGKLSVAAELPVVGGDVSGVKYTTFAVATEASWKFNDQWEADLKAGHAPGQPSSANATPESFRAFFFHPAYRTGLILFNYQLANFAGPNFTNNPAITESSLRSPFDNPVVNATYLRLGGSYKSDKWNLSSHLIYALAPEAANAGQYFYNTVSRKIDSTKPAVSSQGTHLGTEWDASATFQWDESFTFGADLGLLFPGAYYGFSNTATANKLDPVFAAVFRAGVSF
jgi:hypothetical protein